MANTQELFSNNANATLAGAISNVSLALNLASGTGALFPNPNNANGEFFRLSLSDAAAQVNHEIVFVTARTGDTCTIVRAQEDTVAQAWSAGDIAANMNTAGAMQNLQQLSQAQNNPATFAVDTGTVNSVVLAYTPVRPTGAQGVALWFRALNANTGPTTVTINSGTSYNLFGSGGFALQGGELQAGGVYQIVFDSVNARYALAIAGTAGTKQVADGTASHHAASLGQAGFQNSAIYQRVGGVQQVSINGAAFTATGATTFAAPVSGRVKVRLWAGGGGGGGAAGGTGVLSGGAGGGGYREGVLTGLSTATAITVGAGGSAGLVTPTNGGSGGTSSFGALLTALGGGGGQAQSGAGAGVPGTGGGGGGSSSGLTVSGSSGGAGYQNGTASSYVIATGGGSFSAYPQVGPLTAVNSSGFGGVFPGGGATGAYGNVAASTGADGLVIVEW